MYLFEANLSILANTSTLEPLHSTTYSRTSLPTAFVVGPLVLPREKYPYDTIQVRRCMPTNVQRVKSAMIALTGAKAFLRFYQMSS